jgi:hypothetical protein
MTRLCRDIGIEHIIPTQLMVTKIKEGERQCHLISDG